MHELSITQSMLDLVLEYADGHPVTAINLKLGELALVVPESVQLYFEYLSKGTVAQGARLNWEIAPMELTCGDCGEVAELEEWAGERPQLILSNALERGCRHCGSHDLRVTDGTGFAVTSLEIEG
jgi:hydrogenase nickel incorporation protein HypA/HybF